MAGRRVALVTGASRGIGAATALRLAREGFDVAVNYLQSEQKAREVAARVEELGRRALIVRADVADYPQVKAMVARVVDELGGLHVLVNNAGYSSHFAPEALPVDEWRRMLAVTLDAAFYAAKEAIPHMKRAGWGRIVNVSSLRALAGSARGAHYAAAKAGLIGLTKSLALALGPYGITVNAVAPGYTRTDMTRKALEEQGEQILKQIPVRRVAEPEEVAALIAFLCSDEAGSITGETISLNGGIYMR